jgi:hypothetical protein
MKELDDILKAMRKLVYLAMSIAGLMVLTLLIRFQVISFPDFQKEEVVQTTSTTADLGGPIGSVDQESGLIFDEGLDIVKANCGACHSTRLVAQNRLTREGWKKLIRWMQAEQNLWDLGENESIILDYLEKNFAPTKMGRRKRLANIEWYDLNE